MINGSIAGFGRSIQSETVTFELKNGTIVNGTITSVSPLMNVALRAVMYTPKDRDIVTLDTMTVRGSTTTPPSFPILCH